MVTAVDKGRENGGVWYGTSIETKPTLGNNPNHRFIETDTGNVWRWSGTEWFTEMVGARSITTDYFTEVMRGNVSGQEMVHKFGRNAAVPNGSWEFVNNLGFTAWPLSAATTVRVKAGGDANDTSAGTGARNIRVEGIDSNGDEIGESIVLAGASASGNTTVSFWRVHRAFVNLCGTYGAANTGNITIENSGGGTDLLKIEIEEGQSQFAGYTVPDGKTAYLLHLHMSVDGLKPADSRIMTRENITDTIVPVNPKRLRMFFDGVSGHSTYSPRGPKFSIAGLTDIWIEARGSGALTEVSADFELLLVDD